MTKRNILINELWACLHTKKFFENRRCGSMPTLTELKRTMTLPKKKMTSTSKIRLLFFTILIAFVILIFVRSISEIGANWNYHYFYYLTLRIHFGLFFSIFFNHYFHSLFVTFNLDWIANCFWCIYFACIIFKQW